MGVETKLSPPDTEPSDRVASMGSVTRHRAGFDSVLAMSLSTAVMIWPQPVSTSGVSPQPRANPAKEW